MIFNTSCCGKSPKLSSTCFVSPCSIKKSSYSNDVIFIFWIFSSFKTSKIALDTPPCFWESLNTYQSLYFFDNSIKQSLSIGFTNLKSKIVISSSCNASVSTARDIPAPYPINSLFEVPVFSISAFPKIKGVEANSNSLKAPLGYLMALGLVSVYANSKPNSKFHYLLEQIKSYLE